MNKSKTSQRIDVPVSLPAGKETICHRLWLIYSQLKDAEAENDPDRRVGLLSCSREELGQVLNEMNRAVQIESEKI